MSRITFVLGFVLMFFISGDLSAGVSKVKKVALVSFERCILETTQGKREAKKLEAEMARDQAKLERKAKALQKELSDIQAKAAVLSQKELQRRQMELAQDDQELQQLGMEANQKFMRKQAALAEKIYRNVGKIVNQIALEEGIQIVLVRSQATVLYANPKLDITNQVIVSYDKKYR